MLPGGWVTDGGGVCLGAVDAWVDPSVMGEQPQRPDGAAQGSISSEEPKQALPWPWQPDARCYLARMHQAEVTWPHRIHQSAPL